MLVVRTVCAYNYWKQGAIPNSFKNSECTTKIETGYMHSSKPHEINCQHHKTAAATATNTPQSTPTQPNATQQSTATQLTPTQTTASQQTTHLRAQHSYKHANGTTTARHNSTSPSVARPLNAEQSSNTKTTATDPLREDTNERRTKQFVTPVSICPIMGNPYIVVVERAKTVLASNFITTCPAKRGRVWRQ